MYYVHLPFFFLWVVSISCFFFLIGILVFFFLIVTYDLYISEINSIPWYMLQILSHIFVLTLLIMVSSCKYSKIVT